jgi:predicted phosphodiesterase
MRIRLLSDLHLEFTTRNIPFANKADICILCGDIGSPFLQNYQNFLEKIASEHELVLIISGNHEYYGKKTMNETENKINDVINNININNNNNNIQYLQKKTYIYKNIIFIGCTMWSEIIDDKLVPNINDIKYIPDLTFEKYNLLHKEHVAWINNELIKYKSDNKTICVITHHLPSYKLIHNKYKGSRDNVIFASRVLEHFDDFNINYWFYGHTHQAQYHSINKVQCFCNPFGYEHENSNWNPDMLVIVNN